MYKNILVAVDLADRASASHIIRVAHAYNQILPDAKLTFLYVVQSFVNLVDDFFPKEWLDNVQEKSLMDLERLVKHHFTSMDKVSCYTEQGVIYESIVEKSSQIKADLVIMGAQTADRYDYHLGPNTASVVRYCKASILVIR